MIPPDMLPTWLFTLMPNPGGPSSPGIRIGPMGQEHLHECDPLGPGQPPKGAPLGVRGRDPVGEVVQLGIEDARRPVQW